MGSAIALKSAGFSAKDLTCAFSIEELKSAGFSRAEAIDAGFTAHEIECTGFEEAEAVLGQRPALCLVQQRAETDASAQAKVKSSALSVTPSTPAIAVSQAIAAEDRMLRRLMISG